MAQIFPYEAEKKPLGYRATLGMIVLQSDLTLEQDMRRIIPCEGVALYVSRIANAPHITQTSLRHGRGLAPRRLPFARSHRV